VQVGETNQVSGSKELQRLLWAVGEARNRVTRRERTRSRRAAEDAGRTAAVAGSEFFTEWQPTGR
jgi:hypothetical protein